jgi:WD40 repeat protein
VAGVGARVLVYDASDGELLHALKGHKVGNCHSSNTCRFIMHLEHLTTIRGFGNQPKLGLKPVPVCTRVQHTLAVGGCSQHCSLTGSCLSCHVMQDAVYAVAYASNGKRFASGGADKTVIIWTSKVKLVVYTSTWCCSSLLPGYQHFLQQTAVAETQLCTELTC